MIILMVKLSTMKQSAQERIQNICVYGGVFGILISATCLIQLMAMTTSHWLTYSLLSVYTSGLVTFLLLALQRYYAPIFMIVSTALSMVSVTILLIGGFFSLILIIEFFYVLVMTIVVFMENIPSALKNKARLKKQEELVWKDKI